MIDSIKLWLSSAEATSVDLMAELPIKLTNLSTTRDDRTNQLMIKGFLNGLFVIVTENGVTISGSLSKYYYGNNMYTLSFNEIRLAFDMIEHQLGVPIQKAKVQRLDIAQNIIVDYPVSNYFQYHGELTYYKRQEMNNGVYYNGSNQTLLFYDKIGERKVKREKVLDTYIGKNVFRYEMRFEKRLGKLFNKQCVLVSDLLDETFFCDLIRRYIAQYQKIYKHKSLIHYSCLQMRSRAQFWSQIKLLGINALGGESMLLQAVKQARKDKAFSNNMQASRIIQDIKKTYMNNELTESHSLVKELEGKMVEKVAGYLLENGLLNNIGLS